MIFPSCSNFKLLVFLSELKLLEAVQQPTMKIYSSMEFAQRFYEMLALIAQHQGRCPISKQVGCNVLFIVVASSFLKLFKMDTFLFVYSRGIMIDV